MKKDDVRFPFGVFQVPDYDAACHRYCEVVPDLAIDYPLPQTLPRRHPVLRALEGRYHVQDTLPPWWEDCVQALTLHCPCLEPLFRSLGREAYRRGSLDQQRWKTWRNAPCQMIATASSASCPSCWRQHGPSLYGIMDAVLPSTTDNQVWLDRFISRGDKDMPHDLDLVITADPQWWLNMSNGRNWYSCMGSGTDRDPRIIGNWYDTGLLMAALVVRGVNDCWTPDCLIARTTVRVVWEGLSAWDEAGAMPIKPSTPHVAFGRIYHNDLTSACHLLATLATLCEQRGLPWSCIAGTNATKFVRDGSLGKAIAAETPHRAVGTAFWRPVMVEEPYLDGEASYQERSQREQEGIWAYPLLSTYGCHLLSPPPHTRLKEQVETEVTTR
jgi:hypothetical protein